MILSFGWTTDDFLAGRKTLTHRDWKPRTLASWQKAWDEGRLIHDAVDKQLCWGGKRIAKIKLTARPWEEWLHEMTEADVQAEGGQWATVQEYIEFMHGDRLMAAVRFEKVEVTR